MFRPLDLLGPESLGERRSPGYSLYGGIVSIQHLFRSRSHSIKQSFELKHKGLFDRFAEKASGLVARSWFLCLVHEPCHSVAVPRSNNGMDQQPLSPAAQQPDDGNHVPTSCPPPQHPAPRRTCHADQAQRPWCWPARPHGPRGPPPLPRSRLRFPERHNEPGTIDRHRKGNRQQSSTQQIIDEEIVEDQARRWQISTD